MKSKKLPSWQFYPGDWRKDPGIQSLDYESRGIWFEILLIMYESEERGKLTLNGQKMPDEALANLLGLNEAKLKQTLSKLVSYGVAKVEQSTGILYNRRLLKDEQFRALRASAGQKGGQKRASKRQANVKQNPTPSSSSSSSDTVNTDSSVKTDISQLSELPSARTKPDPADKLPAGLNHEAWQLWIQYRRKIKMKPYRTNRQSEQLAKYPAHVQLQAVEESIRQQWQGLFPEKINTGENRGKPKQNAIDRAHAEHRAATARRQNQPADVAVVHDDDSLPHLGGELRPGCD